MFTVFVICAPTEYWQQSTAPHLQSFCLSRFYIDFSYTIYHLLYRRQVTPGTERIDISTHRMDDVIDAVLDNQIGSSGYIHLNWETSCTLQAISLISDAVVLTQDASSTDGTPNDRSICAKSNLSHIVGPRLSSDGIAVANNCMILC